MHMYVARKNVLENREITLILKGEMSFATETSLELSDTGGIGIARIMQTGWFKEVHVKDIDSHSVRALLASRAMLVEIKRDLENHVRGLLKNLGLVIGSAPSSNVFAVRAEELIEGLLS